MNKYKLFTKTLGYLLLITFLFLSFLPDDVSAAKRQRVGEITSAIGEPFVKRGGFHVAIKIGSPIFKDDLIKTSANSRCGIKFIDGSRMNVGSSTNLRINSYVFDEKAMERDVKFGFLKGHIRMLARKLTGYRNTSISLNTPTATIGIRGTEFIAGAVEKAKENKNSVGALEINAPLYAFNGEGIVMTDSAPLMTAQIPGDDEEEELSDWLVYVYCLDGSVLIQNLFGGPVYTILPGGVGWVPADPSLTSVFDIPLDQVDALYLATNITGSDYADGPMSDRLPNLLPPPPGGVLPIDPDERDDPSRTILIYERTTTIVTSTISTTTIPATTTIPSTTTRVTSSVTTTTRNTTTIAGGPQPTSSVYVGPQPPPSP